MLLVILFGILQVAVSLYALRRGGWPERIVAIAMAAALFGGWLLPFKPDEYRQVEFARLGTDVGLWLAIYVVGLRADRYWPLWMGALQILVVTVHGVRGYDPNLLPAAYHHLIAWFSYPMLAMLAIGAYRHAERTSLAGRKPAG